MSLLIARVMSRVVEVGDCLEWTGGYTGTRVPSIKYQGKDMNVRRAIALDTGMIVVNNPLRVAVVRCMNWRCVRPEHIQILQRQKLQRRTANRNHASAKLIGARKISAQARKRAKLTAELAAEIREATDTHREIAKRYGVSHATVYAIKRGITWREYSTPFAHLVGAVT